MEPPLQPVPSPYINFESNVNRTFFRKELCLEGFIQPRGQEGKVNKSQVVAGSSRRDGTVPDRVGQTDYVPTVTHLTSSSHPSLSVTIDIESGPRDPLPKGDSPTTDCRERRARDLPTDYDRRTSSTVVDRDGTGREGDRVL